ncbi:hypothetical protein Droror1_Dr00000867 [Drosera rotundifolia]
MFYDLHFKMGIPYEDLENGVVSHRSIITRLLKHLLDIKSFQHQHWGYLLSVTSLKWLDDIKAVPNPRDGSVFHVAFTCRCFLPCKGEIMEGIVYNVHFLGVFLRCGPVKIIFLASRKMVGYQYHPGDKPAFMNENLSRIEKGVVVRFMVFAVKWAEQRNDDGVREFMVLASLEGDLLGPVALSGTDELDL